MDISRLNKTIQVLDFSYKTLPVALTGSLGGAFLLVLMLYSAIDHTLLYAWFGTLCIVIAGRFSSLYHYQKAKSANSARFIHLVIYYIGAFVTGAAWGSSVYFLTFTNDFAANLMVMLILTGVAAGAIGSNAASTLGYTLFISPIMIPLFLYLIFHPIHEMNIAAYTVLLFVGMLLSISRNFRNQYFSMLNFADDKNDLVSRLSASKKMLEDEIVVRKQTEINLTEAKEAAESASRAKSTFLSHMSHELRTPLNSIIGFSDLLVHDTKLQASHRESAQMILASGNHLLTLVDDVLDLTRIENGTLTLEKKKIALLPTISTCISILQPIANKKNVSISIDINTDHSALYLETDEKRFKQILINLLSNAVKYNIEGGSVRVALRVSESHIVISVEDTGIGIAPERINNLFQLFNRLGHENTGIDGNGIGLVITKQLVSMMNGEISVDSRIGVGTIFRVCFPINTTNIQELESNTHLITASHDSSTNAPKEAKARILVAEDNLPNQLIIRKQLQALGHDVVVVDDGEKALEQWKKEPFDMLITDCHMPVLDGFQLVEAIRKLENGKTKRIPIIALTADAYAEVVTRCAECGVDETVAKPVTMEQLKNIIARWKKDF